MDILKLTGRLHAIQLYYFETKLANLKLKTRPKQLLGYLPIDIVLPAQMLRAYWTCSC
jgi:hypothetical protein